MRMRRIERMLEPLGTSLAPNEETAPVHTRHGFGVAAREHRCGGPSHLVGERKPPGRDAVKTHIPLWSEP